MLLQHGQIFWVLIFLWLKLVKVVAGSHFKAFSGKAVTRVWFWLFVMAATKNTLTMSQYVCVSLKNPKRNEHNRCNCHGQCNDIFLKKKKKFTQFPSVKCHFSIFGIFNKAVLCTCCSK